MSNQGYYGGQAPHDQHIPSNNPWANEVSQQPQQYQYQQQQQQPPQQQSHGGFEPPPGPPPRRTDTFNEERFIPASERGEQREAMEAFEMNRSKPESQTDKDVAQLQQEFPKIDGSLIAALYGDSQSLSGTREMLVELNESQQGQ
ncbi:hypothetical protein AC578_1423 [Pseudocercospora eumusae]|uniref:CUE domain-containing protein n=1 Tax=Pseudocercospora eumusae TaxID=321146 RepID=A0A139HUE4_9PEZI|nr:hypothetical protein AC578_1423 [Pseudocercospora eumusae]